MSPTCAKCGAFGGWERSECGFPIPNEKGGGKCDGRVFTDKHELQRAKDALWWESCLAKSDAEVTRLRAALQSIAALQTEEPGRAPWDATDAVVSACGQRWGHFEASEMARAALVTK